MGGKAQLKVNRPCVPLKLCFRQFVTNPFCEGVRFSASKLGNDIILLHFLIRLRLRLRTIASADVDEHPKMLGKMANNIFFL